MARMSVSAIVSELLKERTQLEIQLRRVNAALSALGKVSSGSKFRGAGARIISAAGRRRIAAAQRARWAKFRASKKAR